MLAALHQQQQAVLLGERRAAAAAAAAAADERRAAALTTLLSPPAASPSPTAAGYYMPSLPGLQMLPTAAYPGATAPAGHPLHMGPSPPLSRQHPQQAQQAQHAGLLVAPTAAELERHSSQALSGYSELQQSGGHGPRGAQLPFVGAAADLLPAGEPAFRYSPAPTRSTEAAEVATGRGTPGHRQALSEAAAAAAVAGAASQSAFALAAARGVGPGLRRARVRGLQSWVCFWRAAPMSCTLCLHLKASSSCWTSFPHATLSVLHHSIPSQVNALVSSGGWFCRPSVSPSSRISLILHSTLFTDQGTGVIWRPVPPPLRWAGQQRRRRGRCCCAARQLAV